jgi:hypothetical protein
MLGPFDQALQLRQLNRDRPFLEYVAAMIDSDDFEFVVENLDRVADFLVEVLGQCGSDHSRSLVIATQSAAGDDTQMLKHLRLRYQSL